MKQFIFTLFFSIIFVSSGALADNENEGIKYKENTTHPVVQFAIFEGLIAGLSWLGTTDFAGVFVITHPWALTEALHDKNDTLLYTGVISAEALAIYTISLNEDKYNRNERFKKNMIAWHVFFGVVGVTDWLTTDNKEETIAMSFIPLIDGGELNMRFKY